MPLDCIGLEGTLKILEQFLLDGSRHQIVFLDRKKLFKARRDPEFKRCLREASLILPVSSSIVIGARFLKEGNLTRYDSFPFVIRLLSLAERINRTVYLLGSRKEELERAERNLKDSFPGLRLVGRFSGFFSRDMQQNVLLAIKKASPSFLLVGNGPPAKDLWILRHKKEFNPGIYLWIGDCFDLFSGKKRNRPRGLLTRIVKSSWKIFLIFPLFYYWILILIYKLFRL
ncbi:N-acetylglucosaminyldiphosphoundecaprenol N-acetyl-beta-D-mannosaminyltransferase [subsurface metagenome]